MQVRALLIPTAVLPLAMVSPMLAACGDDAELAEVKAERDALADELATAESRYELSRANQALIAEIIAEPEAFGDPVRATRERRSTTAAAGRP